MTDPTTTSRYPLRVRGELTEPLSRWLWLVKWVLLIPHIIVLIFLWVAFAVVTVIAFFAILFTGRYPHGLFSFNRGVLRWSWRVSFYGYSALGTDRYPPFSLGEVPDYPATLELDYPARLSRGLVLVKWWLLALPHYLILAALAGATWTVNESTETGGIGLLTLAVLFVGIALLFGNRYPRGLFDLVMGVNRWGLRVAVYATLMTDAYPPFRLDQGGQDAAVPPAPEPKPAAPVAASGTGSTGTPAGRIVALVIGVLIALPGLALAAAGGTGFWLNAQRDAAGFISTPTQTISSSTAAVTIENVHLEIDRTDAYYLSSRDLGQLRIRVTGDGSPVFVGIAPQRAVDAWLAGRAHDEITKINSGEVEYQRRTGAVTVSPPGQQTFWTASASGPGRQELRWQATSGTWSIVTARTDGTAGVVARAAVAAKIPSLTGIATGLLLGGLALLLTGAALIVWGAAGLGHHTNRVGPQPAWPAPDPVPSQGPVS
jgi:hypothetical protein